MSVNTLRDLGTPKDTCPDHTEWFCIIFIPRLHWEEQIHGSPSCFLKRLPEHIFCLFTKEKQKSRMVISHLPESSEASANVHNIHMWFLSPLSYKSKAKLMRKRHQPQLGFPTNLLKLLILISPNSTSTEADKKWWQVWSFPSLHDVSLKASRVLPHR